MLAIIILLLISPIIVLANGFVFQHLWNWFIVPFVGLPSLTLVAAIGVSMTIAFVAHQFVPSNNKDKTPSEIVTEVIAHLITKPLAALLFGWIVTLFM